MNEKEIDEYIEMFKRSDMGRWQSAGFYEAMRAVLMAKHNVKPSNTGKAPNNDKTENGFNLWF